MKKTNNITCDACKYSVDVNASGKVKLCDAPYEHKMYRKKAQKHGNSFSCGYGEPYGVTLAAGQKGRIDG
jgi:hypothetical protein